MTVEQIRGSKRARRAEVSYYRQKHRRCFWTWPFGHVYQTTFGRMACVGCDKRK